MSNKKIENLERLIKEEKILIEKLSDSMNRASRNLFRYQCELNELRSNS